MVLKREGFKFLTDKALGGIFIEVELKFVWRIEAEIILAE